MLNTRTRSRELKKKAQTELLELSSNNSCGVQKTLRKIENKCWSYDASQLQQFAPSCSIPQEAKHVSGH